jgi:eukaryotic-like serine/threonine-protein kinase
MTDPRADLIIADRYRLDAHLSKGGMGAVWRGFDKKLRRAVAVKVLHPKWASSADARARFEREAMAVAQLSCPHVVQVFDYGVFEESPYIVMELLEGEDLLARLKKQRRLSFEETTRIVWQTARALGEAHGVGIVHRDLKPGNIFLSGKDEEIVKVLDFGVAKLLDEEMANDEEHTRDGIVVGTPHYMSPEQARGVPGSIDHRADLWSLGVIIYRALTGKVPFGGQTATDVLVALLTHQPYPRATEIAPDLPHEVDEFFTKALARDPAHRFQTAKELAKAFGTMAPMSMPSLQLPKPAAELLESMIDGGLDPMDSDAIRRIAVIGADRLEDTLSSEPETVGPSSQISIRGLSVVSDRPSEHDYKRGRWKPALAAAVVLAGGVVAATAWLSSGDEASPPSAPVAADAPRDHAPVVSQGDAPAKTTDEPSPQAVDDGDEPAAAVEATSSEPAPKASAPPPRVRAVPPTQVVPPTPPPPKAPPPAPPVAPGPKPSDLMSERL